MSRTVLKDDHTTALVEVSDSIADRDSVAQTPRPGSTTSGYDSDDVLLDVTEAAALLRVSPETVKYLRSQRRFAPAVKIGRRVLWLRRDLVDWRNQQRESR